MAGVAGQSGGMIGRSDLRESLWFGGISLVTADVQSCRVQFGGLDGARVCDMICQRSVACFAVHMRMPAVLLFFQDIRMTILTGLVTAETYRTSGDFGVGIAAVVSILSEALRYQKCPHSYQGQADDGENRGQPEEVTRID